MKIPETIQISQEDKDTLQKLFKKGSYFSISYVCDKTRLGTLEVAALFNLILDYSNIYIDGFHSCDKEIPILSEYFGRDFLDAGQKCILCGKIIETDKNLIYDLAIKLKNDIIIED